MDLNLAMTQQLILPSMHQILI